MMNILAVEGRDKALVQLGHDGVDRLVAPMLDGLHLFDPDFQVMRILQKVAQQARTLIHGAGKLGKQLKKFGLARNKTDHVTISWSKVGNCVLSHASQATRKETGHVDQSVSSGGRDEF